MLDIIDKYILKLFFGYFFGGLIVLFSLYATVDALSQFSSQPTSLALLLKYYAYATPAMIYQLLPAVCLAATLFTLGHLNKNNELIALFSLGNSLARISAPVLVSVAMISVVSFWMGDRILPYSNKMKNYVWYVDIRNKPGMYSSVKNSKIWYRQKNMLFNIKTFDSSKKTAEGLSFYFFNDKWDLVQMIVAKHAQVQKGEWELEDGNVTLFTEESSFPLTQNFEKKSILVDEDVGDIQQATNFSEVVSISELKQYIAKNKEAGLNTLRYEVDLQSKYGLALASFVMAFIGIPFSVFNNRTGGGMRSTILCLGLAFAYWALLNTGLTLGNQGVIPPIMSAWIPNIFMLGLSSVFLLRLKR